MQKTDFDRAMDFVLKWEGGFVDHPDDPGGATNYGISSAAHGLTYQQVKDLSIDQAKKIYHQQYWLAAGCDKLDWPMNLIVFDTAVNMGVSRATTWLKGKPAPDDYIAQRMRHYISLTELWPTFGRGWMNRVQDLLDYADWIGSEDPDAQHFHLVQIFEGEDVINYYPMAQTIGRTASGKPKLMIRVEPRSLLDKLKSIFS